MNLNEIGIYQLENLINQKVPFKLFDLTGTTVLKDFFSGLNSYYKNFFFGNIIELNPALEIESLRNKFTELNLTTESPIVLLCMDGLQSSKLAKDLSAQGYLNIYVITNGIISIQK